MRGAYLLVNFLNDKVRQRRIYLSIDRQCPPEFSRKAAAFYRILFCHEHSVGAGKFQVGRCEHMVIGKGVRRKGQPEAS